MRKTILLLALVAVFWGCEKENPGPEITFVVPEKVELVFPLNNSQCNEGTDITGAESTITFEWRIAENADEYELVITNLKTNAQSSYTTPLDTLPVTLQRATPYSWYVVAKSNASDSSSMSAAWKFYAAGDGIQSYAPFPAEIVFPKMSESITSAPATLTLDWEGSDVDGDIIGYDVYFGKANPPELRESNLSESQLANVGVTAGTVYYWSITTKDAFGNASESGVYQFKVE